MQWSATGRWMATVKGLLAIGKQTVAGAPATMDVEEDKKLIA